MRLNEKKPNRYQEEASRIMSPLAWSALGYYNSEQLRAIYLGLDRLKLVQPLQGAVKELASQILIYGVIVHDWADTNADYLDE